MARIIEILYEEKKTDVKGKYFHTHALLDNQNEVRGFSRTPGEYQVGDEVMSFFNDKWNYAQMIKKAKSVSSD